MNFPGMTKEELEEWRSILLAKKWVPTTKYQSVSDWIWEDLQEIKGCEEKEHQAKLDALEGYSSEELLEEVTRRDNLLPEPPNVFDVLRAAVKSLEASKPVITGPVGF